MRSAPPVGEKERINKSAPTGHLLQFEFEFEFNIEFVTIECDCEISSIRTGCVRANIIYD